nr:MAG: ORF3 [Giant panda anellovirus]
MLQDLKQKRRRHSTAKKKSHRPPKKATVPPQTGTRRRTSRWNRRTVYSLAESPESEDFGTSSSSEYED